MEKGTTALKERGERERTASHSKPGISDNTIEKREEKRERERDGDNQAGGVLVRSSRDAG